MRSQRGRSRLFLKRGSWLARCTKQPRLSRQLHRSGGQTERPKGSVAKSTHAGIPWLQFIRQRLGARVHFWPFDGWEVPAGRSVIVEVYPRLWSRSIESE